MMTSRSPKYDELYDHAMSGGLIALVPCNDTGDVMKVGKRAIDAGLHGWIGDGFSEHGREECVILTCCLSAQRVIREFVRRVNMEAKLSVALAEGFEVTLHEVVVIAGKPEAVLQTTFGSAAQITSDAGKLVLNFQAAELEPPSNKDEWIERLEAAFSQIHGIASFNFIE